MKTFKLYSYFFPSSYNFLVYVLTNFTSISTLFFFLTGSTGTEG